MLPGDHPNFWQQNHQEGQSKKQEDKGEEAQWGQPSCFFFFIFLSENSWTLNGFEPFSKERAMGRGISLHVTVFDFVATH